MEIESIHDPKLHFPHLANGSATVVLLDLHADTARVSSDCAHAAKLFARTVVSQGSVPLRSVDAAAVAGAADAFATPTSAGLGGWWLPPGKQLEPQNILWFSIPLVRSDLPAWFKSADSDSLQSCIAALEGLAQLILLLLQHKEQHVTAGRAGVTIRQLCDNIGMVSSSNKGLSQTLPLAYVLQACGFWASKLGVLLKVSFIPGTSNE